MFFVSEMREKRKVTVEEMLGDRNSPDVTKCMGAEIVVG